MESEAVGNHDKLLLLVHDRDRVGFALRLLFLGLLEVSRLCGCATACSYIIERKIREDIVKTGE